MVGNVDDEVSLLVLHLVYIFHEMTLRLSTLASCHGTALLLLLTAHALQGSLIARWFFYFFRVQVQVPS